MMTKDQAHQAMIDAVSRKDAAALVTARKAFTVAIVSPLSTTVEGRRLYDDSTDLAKPGYNQNLHDSTSNKWERVERILKNDAWIKNLA